MKYTAKSFSVPASGQRKDPCEHGWIDKRGKCVLCGEKVAVATIEDFKKDFTEWLDRTKNSQRP